MIFNWKTYVKDKLSGKGLEIGALHQPFTINDKTVMTYVDEKPAEVLRKMYPEIKGIINNNIVADACDLPFKNGEFDFVCSSHVLEHLVNPVKALYEWFNVIRTGGTNYLVVPDKRYTFDKLRDVTSVQHLVNDYNNDVDDIITEHYIDFYVNVHDFTKEQCIKAMEAKKSIHVHTFTYESIMELLKLYEKKIGYKIIGSKLDGINICVIMRKYG